VGFFCCSVGGLVFLGGFFVFFWLGLWVGGFGVCFLCWGRVWLVGESTPLPFRLVTSCLKDSSLRNCPPPNPSLSFSPPS